MLEELKKNLREFMMDNWSQTQIKEYCEAAQFKNVKAKDVKDPALTQINRYQRILQKLKEEYERSLIKKESN